MPGIAAGRPGVASGFASPGRMPRKGMAFRGPVFNTRNASLSGVTRDGSGNPLGSCTVHLFQALNDTQISTTISDGSGNFTFLPTASGPFYLVAYLPGSPDVAGTTVNTLVAS